MDELKTNAKAMLARARVEATPTLTQQAQLLKRLQSAPVGPDGPDGPETAPANAGHRPWSLAVGVVAVAALLVLAMVLADRPATESPARVVPPVVGHHTDGSETEHAHAASDPPLLSSPKLPAEPTLKAKRLPKKPRPAVDQGPPAEPSATLADEIALLKRARRALQARDYTLTRATATQYFTQFAAGTFREELQVLDLIASCRSGLSEALADKARRYVAGERSAFVERVSAACLDDR